MKNNLRVIILGLFFTISKMSYSQHASLGVYYSFSEKSKDSHSTIETFSLTGEKLAYSVTYSGRRSPGEKDDSKIFRLTDEQLSAIHNMISKYHLNVTDSLIDNKVNSPSYSITTTILITLTSRDKTTTIKVKGDHGILEDAPLYTHAAHLVGTLRQMAIGLH